MIYIHSTTYNFQVEQNKSKIEKLMPFAYQWQLLGQHRYRTTGYTGICVVVHDCQRLNFLPIQS
jgi:hypothetical protein